MALSNTFINDVYGRITPRYTWFYSNSNYKQHLSKKKYARIRKRNKKISKYCFNWTYSTWRGGGKGGEVNDHELLMNSCCYIWFWFPTVIEKGHCRLGSGIHGVDGAGNFTIRGARGVAFTFILREQLRVRTTCRPGKPPSQKLIFAVQSFYRFAISSSSSCSSFTRPVWLNFLLKMAACVCLCVVTGATS